MGRDSREDEGHIFIIHSLLQACESRKRVTSTSQFPDRRGMANDAGRFPGRCQAYLAIPARRGR